MSDVPTNGTLYRLQNLEKRLDRIEALEPSVMKSQLNDVKDDIAQIAEDVRGLRRVLIGFIVSFAIATAALVVTILQASGGT